MKTAEPAASVVYDEVIGIRGVDVPFVPDIITPNIERPMRKGRYEYGECKSVQDLVKAGDRVLELGGGVGLVSTIASQVEGVGAVWCVEANPDLIPLIHETHRLNGVEGVKVTNAIATNSETGIRPFYIRQDFWASSMDGDTRSYARIKQVPARTLRSLIETFSPSVIIADIEGGELDLFERVDLSGIRLIMMEVHRNVYGKEGEDRILEMLEAEGFSRDPDHSKGSVWVLNKTQEPQRHTFVRPATAPTTLPDATHSKADPKITIVTCMKNEGPFILEWIAYHRSIGVTDFVVFSNDCDDGSDMLLDQLDRLGLITHLLNPVTVTDNKFHQPRAIAYSRSLPKVKQSDYVIYTDVDEYIVIRSGQGQFRDLIDAVGPFHVLTMSELNFSSSGLWAFEDVWITETFTEHEPHYPGERQAHRGIKQILHGLDAVDRPSIHRPILREGFEDETIWLDGSGRPVGEGIRRHSNQNGYDRRGAYKHVCLNHYPLRSVESFLVKLDRGDVVTDWKRVDEKYYQQRALGGRTGGWIQPRLPKARQEWVRMTGDQTLMKLHHMCVEEHKKKIKRLVGEAPVQPLIDWIRKTYF